MTVFGRFSSDDDRRLESVLFGCAATTLLVSLLLGVSPRTAVLGSFSIVVTALGAARLSERCVPSIGRSTEQLALVAWAIGPVVTGTTIWVGSTIGQSAITWSGMVGLVVAALLPSRRATRPELVVSARGVERSPAVPLIALLLVVPWFSSIGTIVTVIGAGIVLSLEGGAEGARSGLLRAWGWIIVIVGTAGVSTFDSADLLHLRSPILSNDVFFDELQAIAIADRGVIIDPLADGARIGYHRLPHAWAGQLHRLIGASPFEVTAGLGVAFAVTGLALLLTCVVAVSPSGGDRRVLRLLPLVIVLAASPIEPVWMLEFPKIGNSIGLLLLGVVLRLAMQPWTSPGRDHWRLVLVTASLIMGLTGAKVQFALIAFVASAISLLTGSGRPLVRTMALLGLFAGLGFVMWFQSLDRLQTWSAGDDSTRINDDLGSIVEQFASGAMTQELWRLGPPLLAVAALLRSIRSASAADLGLATSVGLMVTAGEPSKFASAGILSAAIALGDRRRVDVVHAVWCHGAGTRGRSRLLVLLGALGFSVAAGFEVVKWSFPADGFRRTIYDLMRSEAWTVGLLITVAGAAACVWSLRSNPLPSIRKFLLWFVLAALTVQGGSFVAKVGRTYVSKWRYPASVAESELRSGLPYLAQVIRVTLPSSVELATNTFCHAPRRAVECIGPGSAVQIGALSQRQMYLEAPILRSTSEDLDVRGRAGTSLRFALFADPLAARELRRAGVSYFVVDMTRTDRTSWEPVGRTILISGDFALVELRSDDT